MIEIKDFAAANRYLAGFYDNARTAYTLDNMRALMKLLGNPQDSIPVIHVAGTSGKTSTAYYSAALLTAAGFKTGLTVSPHVDEINERLQINLQPLPEAQFCAALTEFLEIILASDIKPSWFELMVAFAYWYFVRERVDYAVVEVGLGGLKDGTNVITRADKSCIITDIGFDHTKILGKSLAEIAGQKAGIIQPHNDVFMYQQGGEVMTVIEEIAAKQQAQLQIVEPATDQFSQLPLFQQRNFHLAERTIDHVLNVAKHPYLTDKQLQQASQAYIPGRMEIIDYKGKILILDGAHNAQKLSALADSLHVKYPQMPVAGLIAFAEGDETRLDGALEVLASITQDVIVTSFVTAKDYLKHSVDLQEVTKHCQERGINAEPISDIQEAFGQLLRRPELILLVTGSFYLLNHIRPLIQN